MENLRNESELELRPQPEGELPDYNVAVIVDGLREPEDRQYSDPVVSEHKRRMDCFETVRAQFLERVRQEARQEVERELGLPTYWRSGDKQKYLADWHQKMARLAKADAAPRCEHVFQDGTQCGSPRMKTGRLCYAHERMAQVRPQKLNLLAMEDANSIMLNIMEINRALVDDEITEKRARILLYSQQLGLQALGKLTFHTAQKEEMVRERMGHLAADGRRQTQVGEEERTAKEEKLVSREGARTETNEPEEVAADPRITTQVGAGQDDAPSPYPSQDLNELAGDIPAASVAATVGAASKREAANLAGIALG